MKPPIFAVLALLFVACESKSPDSTTPAPALLGALPASPARPAPECAATAAGARLSPVDSGGVGSSVALARFGARTVGFVADEQDEALRAVDIDARTELARTPLGGRPAQVLILADGRVVVSLRDRAALEVLEGVEGATPDAPLARRCLVEAAAEPVGLATTPDGATLLVASRWGHALTAYAARDLSKLGAVDLPRDPTAVAASADGRAAFVTHAVGGRMSVVDLAEAALLADEPPGLSMVSREGPPLPAPVRELTLTGVEWRRKSGEFLVDAARGRGRSFMRVERAGGQGFALARAADGAILAPQVLVDVRPSETGGGYGGASTGTVLGAVAIVDARGERAVVPSVSASQGLMDCFLPRAAALDPEESTLLVGCLGLDAVIAYDAAKAPRGSAGITSGVSSASRVKSASRGPAVPLDPHARELFRVAVGAGPTGIAVDAATRRAVVFSQFAGELRVFPLGRALSAVARAAAAASIALPSARPLSPELARGRTLFHAVSTRRIASDGRACASCHPDGRDDALSWSTQEGPRQTPMLLGRLQGTAPFGWQGDMPDLQRHFARTIGRLGGLGLGDAERDALFGYIASLAAPREPAADSPAALAAQRLARGEALFHEEKVGCVSCHLGDDETTDGVRHDVASATAQEKLHFGGAFETPSLRFVARTAPYFHDGRYPTLAALLRGSDGTMGHTGHLSDPDREALAAYVASL